MRQRFLSDSQRSGNLSLPKEVASRPGLVDHRIDDGDMWAGVFIWGRGGRVTEDRMTSCVEWLLSFISSKKKRPWIGIYYAHDYTDSGHLIVCVSAMLMAYPLVYSS